MISQFERKCWVALNRMRLSILHVQYGKNLRIFNNIYIRLGNNSKIVIGDNFTFSSGGGYNPLARNIKGAIEMEEKASIYIGNNVGISASCLWIYKSLRIGDRTKIGGDCIIIDSDAHSLNYLERRNGETDRPRAKSKGIVIEEDVLIGARCIILKGVTIGARSIVGAGSVISKDIPADCIAAGNPAKVIKLINQ